MAGQPFCTVVRRVDVVCAPITDDPVRFAGLTFPRYRPVLGQLPPGAIAIGASLAGKPVGLALATRRNPRQEARLLSVMVASSVRRGGIGTLLMHRLQSAFAENGDGKLIAYHSTRLAARPAFEALLARSGWSAPAVYEIRGAGHCAAVVAELDRLRPARRGYLPPGAVIEPWASVTDADRAAMQALLAGPDALGGDLDPARHEPAATPQISVVLRLDGQVIGWVIGERDANGVCYYWSGFVVARWRRSGALIGLVRDVCARQAAAFGPDSIARLSTVPAIPAMARFIRERLGPIGLWVDDFLTSEWAAAAKP